MSFWHTFDELVAELTEHRDAIAADAEAGNPHADGIVNWYNANRTDPTSIGGREIEKCWRMLDDWKRSREEEKMVDTNELSKIESKAKQTITPKANDALEEAKMINIVDDEGYEIVGNWLTGLKSIMKEIDETFDPTLDAQALALKLGRAAKARHYKPLQEAEVIGKAKMAAYYEGKQREKIEADKKLRLEAQQKAEADQKARASALAAAGKAEAAKALISRPVQAPPVIDNTPIVPKIDGIAERENWDFRVTDATLVPLAYLVVDEVKVRKVVNALGADCVIPGIEVFKKTIIAAGAR